MEVITLDLLDVSRRSDIEIGEGDDRGGSRLEFLEIGINLESLEETFIPSK